MPNGNFIVNVPLDPSGAATMPIVLMLNWLAPGSLVSRLTGSLQKSVAQCAAEKA